MPHCVLPIPYTNTMTLSPVMPAPSPPHCVLDGLQPAQPWLWPAHSSGTDGSGMPASLSYQSLLHGVGIGSFSPFFHRKHVSVNGNSAAAEQVQRSPQNYLEQISEQEEVAEDSDDEPIAVDEECHDQSDVATANEDNTENTVNLSGDADSEKSDGKDSDDEDSDIEMSVQNGDGEPAPQPYQYEFASTTLGDWMCIEQQYLQEKEKVAKGCEAA